MRMSSTWLLNDLQDRVLTMGGRQLSEYGLPQPRAVDKFRLVLKYHWEIDYEHMWSGMYHCYPWTSRRCMITFVPW